MKPCFPDPGCSPKGVIEREKAAIGALITLREPTKPMLTEAAAAGFYESKEFPGRYPRVFVTLSPWLVILTLSSAKGKDLCISLRVNSAKGLFRFKMRGFFAPLRMTTVGKKLEYPTHRVETFAKAERKTEAEQEELF
jgi:hypothetical protein